MLRIILTGYLAVADSAVIQDEPVDVVDENKGGYALRAWTYNGCEIEGKQDIKFDLKVEEVNEIKVDAKVSINVGQIKIAEIEPAIECYFSGGGLIYRPPLFSRLIISNPAKSMTEFYKKI